MKLVASRKLRAHPAGLIASADTVIVLTSHSGTSFLDCYGPGLEPRWSRQLESTAHALLNVNQTVWVFDSEGAWACGSGGECDARVRLRPREGMELAAIGSVGDGFLFAWQHDIRTPMSPPLLERVGRDGSTRWCVTLPVDPVAYEGVVQMRADDGWRSRPKPPWTPETWVAKSKMLTMSGDAALACFNEFPRSGIGFGSVVSVADGAPRFTTKTGPVSEVATLGGGEFLVGYQGYGAFETLRYDRDGGVPERWASHGHYLISDGLRVIELENILPSKMHLTRLLPGGTVRKGDRFDGYYTSRPLLSADGTAYFFRNGDVLAARDLTIEERLSLTAANDDPFSSAAVGDDRRLYVAYTLATNRTCTNLVQIEL